MRIRPLYPLLLGVLCTWAVAGPAEEPQMVPATAEADRAVNVPFAFYSEFFGAAAGFVTFRPGYPQPQARVLGRQPAPEPWPVWALLSCYIRSPKRATNSASLLSKKHALEFLLWSENCVIVDGLAYS